MNENKKNYDIHYVKTKCKQYTLMLSKENLKGGSPDDLRALLENKSGKTAEKVK